MARKLMAISTEIVEKINILLQDKKYSHVPVKIFHQIGESTQLERRELSATIKKMTDQRPEFAVIGGYNRGNIWSKPKNSYVTIRDTQIIMNINDHADRLGILVNTSDPIVTDFLSDIIKSLSKAFIMIVGNRIEEVMEEISIDNEICNIEYGLSDFHPQEDRDGITIINLLEEKDKIGETKLVEIIDKLWGYNSLENLITPHVAALSDTSEIMGGARVNELVEDTAIIGGVITVREHRQKGVGTVVSSSLVELLSKRGYYIYLATDVNNIPARRIYEKLGFQKLGKSYFFDIGTNVIEEAIIGDRDY